MYCKYGEISVGCEFLYHRIISHATASFKRILDKISHLYFYWPNCRTCNNNLIESANRLMGCLLSATVLSCLLMKAIASFLRYTGYLNFINGPISHVLLLILVHVQLLSCLFFLTSCLTAIKNHVIKYCTAVYEMNG